MSSAADRKPTLRAELTARRAAHPPDRHPIDSQHLAAHLLAHPLWRNATSVAAFVGVRGEPDTRFILEQTLAAGKQLWLPRVIDRQSIEFWLCTDLATLAPAGFGLLEPPASGPGVVLPPVELMLVPGLGFGRDGARIGFGKGHYDRALAGRRGDGKPTLVGIAFEFAIGEANWLPMEPPDVWMDWLASELGVERCQP